MSLLALVAALGGLFLLLEVLFFFYCFRWLSSGRRAREREFARLDAERAELIELQSALASDLRAAKQLSEETVARLGRLGAEAGAEWREMMDRMSALSEEIDRNARKLSDDVLSKLQRGRMTLDKGVRDAAAVGVALDERLARARDLLRFFEREVPTEEIVKELQAEKYERARRMLSEGMETGAICKKLGLTHGEVSLLSFVK
jgi:hypothetical protein